MTPRPRRRSPQTDHALAALDTLERQTVADALALDRLNLMLSAPDWSVSMLEDAAEIVRGTGRAAIEGAEWEPH